MTIDNRTRSLIVSQPPEGFDASALEHFSRLVLVLIITDDLILIVYFISSINMKSNPYIIYFRFGEIQDISPLPDGSMTVQFKERRDAESAKAKGAFYNSVVLLLDWQESDATLLDE
jgi:hypothetical protein